MDETGFTGWTSTPLDPDDMTLLAATKHALSGVLPGSTDTKVVALREGGQTYILTELNPDRRFPQTVRLDRNGLVTGALDVDQALKSIRETVGIRKTLGFESLTFRQIRRPFTQQPRWRGNGVAPCSGPDNSTLSQIFQ